VTATLTVIVPVYNEREKVAPTLANIDERVQEAPAFDAEILVVDDGSSDGTAGAARAVTTTKTPVRVVSYTPNRGLFSARLAGLEAATGEYVLFLDAGAVLEPGSLPFLASQIPERRVWNGHTIMESSGRPFEQFWDVVTHIAFHDYLREPRETSFGAEEFDRYPKGGGCFFVPRALMLEAVTQFESKYADLRHSSDDTTPLRWLAAQERINISPQFAYTYTFGESLQGFLKHAYRRGVHFLDGHGRPESRFFPLAAAFYPVSAALALGALRKPLIVPVALVALGGAAAVAAVAKGRSRDAAAFAWTAPLYALAHGLGMWKGLVLAAANRTRS
jgi:glycosyltransferase involved in cell wall biosynthesis